jgi:hypothetical protein
MKYSFDPGWRIHKGISRALIDLDPFKAKVFLIKVNIALLFLLFGEIHAQNLVPNPGFEEYLTNPDYSPTGVNKAPDWSRLDYTTDFFHIQYKAPSSVPSNFRGTKQPAAGEGYAGLISFAGSGSASNEFLVVQLKEPLQADQIYDLSFEVSLSNLSRFGVDGIGALVLHE